MVLMLVTNTTRRFQLALEAILDCRSRVAGRFSDNFNISFIEDVHCALSHAATDDDLHALIGQELSDHVFLRFHNMAFPEYLVFLPVARTFERNRTYFLPARAGEYVSFRMLTSSSVFFRESSGPNRLFSGRQSTLFSIFLALALSHLAFKNRNDQSVLRLFPFDLPTFQLQVNDRKPVFQCVFLHLKDFPSGFRRHFITGRKAPEAASAGHTEPEAKPQAGPFCKGVFRA